MKEKFSLEKALQRFQAKTKGATFVEGHMIVPALQYENTVTFGRNFIKCDGMEKMADGTTVLLIDAKTKLATWGRKTEKTLERIEKALMDNPGHKVVYEFANAKEMEKAEKFIINHEFNHVVSVRVREP